MVRLTRDIGYTKEGERRLDYSTIPKIYDLIDAENNVKAEDFIFADEGDQYVTLHNINLGIREMVKPSYTISQNPAYAILKVNNIEYKYIYKQNGKIDTSRKNR